MCQICLQPFVSPTDTPCSNTLCQVQCRSSCVRSVCSPLSVRQTPPAHTPSVRYSIGPHVSDLSATIRQSDRHPCSHTFCQVQYRTSCVRSVCSPSSVRQTPPVHTPSVRYALQSYLISCGFRFLSLRTSAAKF
jgi:hypothetical protein